METLMPLTYYRTEIDAAAAHVALDPDLVDAMVLVESSGHTDAFRHEPDYYARYLAPIISSDPHYQGLSPRRCGSSYGLMQVMYPTAVDLGYRGMPEGLFVPAIGLDYGCRYLAGLLRWAGGDDHGPQRWKAVAAYNTGKGHWASPAGQAYIQKVQGALARVVATKAPGGEKLA